jgi:interferon-induced transmembrane protein
MSKAAPAANHLCIAHRADRLHGRSCPSPALAQTAPSTNEKQATHDVVHSNIGKCSHGQWSPLVRDFPPRPSATTAGTRRAKSVTCTRHANKSIYYMFKERHMQPGYQHMQPGYSYQLPSVKNNMTMSIISIFLFWPLAIPAIFNASKVNTLVAAGDIARAQRASAKSRKWSRLAIIAGIIVIGLGVVWYFTFGT